MACQGMPELRVIFDTCVFPAHTPQHPEIVGCGTAIYLKPVTRKRAPLIHNVSHLLRNVLFLARPYGRRKLGLFSWISRRPSAESKTSPRGSAACDGRGTVKSCR